MVNKGFLSPKVLLPLLVVGLLIIPLLLLQKSQNEKTETIKTDKRVLSVSTSEMKGVAWHMGDWYSTTLGGYDKEGMKMDLDNMKAAGITWMRTSAGPNTCSLTSLQNTGTCSFYDWLIPELKSRGINWLPTVQKNGAAPKDLGTEQDRQTYKDWLSRFVTRYKDDLKYWEIHNEPNSHYFWNIDENDATSSAYAQSVSNYVEHLRDSYTTIKAVDPNLMVVSAGLSQWKSDPFMDKMIELGADQYLDIFGYHPYSDQGPDGVMGEINKVKNKLASSSNWAAKPIWVTELGFQLNAYPGFVSSEQQKADYIVQTWNRLKDGGINLPIILYVYSFAPPANIVDIDKAAHTTTFRPAYDAYKNLWMIAPPPPPPEPSAPVVSITSPTAGQSVSGSVNVAASATDDGQVVRVDFLSDGLVFGTDTTSPHSTLWNTTAYVNNSNHSLTAVATDDLGLVASSSAVSVKVLDVTAPTSYIVSPANGATVLARGNVTISAVASDPSGITKVEFYVNNSLKCTDTTTLYSCVWSVPGKVGAAYTIVVKAYDTAGNRKDSTVTVTSGGTPTKR